MALYLVQQRAEDVRGRRQQARILDFQRLLEAQYLITHLFARAATQLLVQTFAARQQGPVFDAFPRVDLQF